MSVPHPELERWRAEFPILQTRAYLNSCSLGALSLRSMGYLGEYQALWNTLGASAWYELWMGRLAELRRRVAEHWSAREAEVALSPSVSGALSSIASAVDYSRRNRVVVAELDFPTLAYQWLAKKGVEVVRVPSDDGVGVDPARWAEAVDERTALVATSHVFYSTGYVQELEPIARAAHSVGALCLIDGYHGMGQIPIDPRAAGVDVYVAGPLKWMLGGPGLAYLWVREERIAELEPTHRLLVRGPRPVRVSTGAPGVPRRRGALRHGHAGGAHRLHGAGGRGDHRGGGDRADARAHRAGSRTTCWSGCGRRGWSCAWRARPSGARGSSWCRWRTRPARWRGWRSAE